MSSTIDPKPRRVDCKGLCRDITLVCQDWGGLTGLSVVKDAAERFSSLVIMNTGLPAPILDLSDNNESGTETVKISEKIFGVGSH